MEIKTLQIAKAKSADELLLKKDLQSGFWMRMFLKAKELDASDIHVEMIKQGMIIRLRVKGDLVKLDEVFDERDAIRSYVNRLKMICRMNLCVDDEAQDKSLSLECTNSRYRIALCPSVFGESFVFRVIKEDDIQSLKNLHLDDELEKNLLNSINKKQGFICITGPTGSGKSTTSRNIFSISC